MDCVGCVSSERKISFFTINDNFHFEIYKSFTPPNLQCIINAVSYHPKKDDLLYATTNGVFSLNSIPSSPDTKTANDAIDTVTSLELESSNNISCVATHKDWFGYTIKNQLNVISWDDQQTVTNRRHKENFNSISFIANRYIIGADIKGTILLHNCNSHILSSSFDDYINQNSVNYIDVTKNRINWFIACNDSGFVYLFDITREKLLYYDYTHNAPSSQCSFNPMYSSLFVSCGLDKSILVHDVNRKKIAMHLDAQHPLSTIKYLRGSDKHIMCTSSNGYVYLYDLRKFNRPIHETYTANCILDLDIHATLKYSDIQQTEIKEEPQKAEMEKQEQIEVDRENVCRVHAESPISSAVSKLPSIQDLNKTFENIHVTAKRMNRVEIVTENVNDNETELECVEQKESQHENNLGVEKEQDIKVENKYTRILTEEKVREIVHDEVMKSEKRMLSEIAKMMNTMHLDLIEQFIHNEMSTEKNMQSLMDFVKKDCNK